MSGDLTLEDILNLEGLDYKETSGSSGAQLNIKECPRCGKDKWKVYAGRDSSLGNCFSCDLRFNLFGFVRELLEGRGGTVENRDVAAYLADAKRKLGYKPREKVAPKVHVEIGKVVLPTSRPLDASYNHPYLEQRGITGEYAAAYHLRYSMFGTHRYTQPNGETKDQSFRERIIIPVFDLDGELKTFQGRDVTGISENRYIFAGGLPGTARYLYNGHTAKALHAKHVLMCEGPTDVIKAQIALDQAEDLKKIVAIGTFGMDLTKSPEGDDQVSAFSKLKRLGGLETVTIMWDGEPKAYEKALVAADILLGIGLNVRIATLPFELDPGDADATVIHRCVRDAKPYSKLSGLKLRMNNPYKVKQSPA